MSTFDTIIEFIAFDLFEFTSNMAYVISEECLFYFVVHIYSFTLSSSFSAVKLLNRASGVLATILHHIHTTQNKILRIQLFGFVKYYENIQTLS